MLRGLVHKRIRCGANTLLLIMLLCATVVPCVARVSFPRAVENVSTLYSSVTAPAYIAFDASGDILLTSYYPYCTIDRIRRIDGNREVLAGTSGSCGFADGAALSASFHSPIGIAFHKEMNVLYIGDEGTHRIRIVNLSTRVVSTGAGSSSAGVADGFGTAAVLYSPTYLVMYTTPSGGIIYVTDHRANNVRKFDLSTRFVSTLTTGVAGLIGLCGTRDGKFLYSAGDGNQIVRVNVSSGAVVVLAGSGAAAFADGVATKAAFNKPRGITLNSDESLLIIGEWYNLRVRQLDLETLSVTTIAGTGAQGFADGPPLKATFNSIAGCKWTCAFSIHGCGVLVTDFQVGGSIRYVPVVAERATQTAAPSLSSTTTRSRDHSSSATASTTNTNPVTNEVTQSHSATISASRLLSRSLTSADTCSTVVSGSETIMLSMSRTERQTVSVSPAPVTTTSTLT